MNSDAMFSSKTDQWATPQELFDRLDAEFHFTLDPCSTDENAKCERHFTSHGLERPWGQSEVVFMNPPYGRGIGEWVAKAYRESETNTVVCLLPARTDTRWWHEYVMKASEIRLVRGRLKFGDAKYNAPFPSAVVVFRPGAATTRWSAA